MDAHFCKIKRQISSDAANAGFTKQGYEPLFSGSTVAKIVIIGQAPGKKAQDSAIPWNDKSGENLRSWLGLTSKQFYDENLVALIPMDFYYPGKGTSGDLPPRKGFAPLWHPQLLNSFTNKPLIILVGQYSQNYYLENKGEKLTDTVKNYKQYRPKNYFPLPHPSPRNNIWLAKNPWFKKEVVPELQKVISKKLK